MPLIAAPTRRHHHRCTTRTLSVALALTCAFALGACSDATTPDAASGGPIVQPLPGGRDAVVQRVVDGDTLVLTNGERVRLIGIDTPETVKPDSPVECFGEDASKRTKALLPAGTGIRLAPDREQRDRYGRTLAYVYRSSGGLFVNASLIDGGYATTLKIAPNTQHAAEFASLQKVAQKDGRGLWGACKN